MKTFKGKPVTLLGQELKVGSKTKSFKVVDNYFELVDSTDFDNEYLIINVVPSLDTAVCDIQTTTIYEEMFKIDNIDIKAVTISNDLPFAQARWSSNAELEDIGIYSDYLHHDFGEKFGALINENKLLLRSVFVLNKKREVIYVEYADEVTQHLNYDELLTFIQKIPTK